MKRKTVHRIFALVSIALLFVVGWQMFSHHKQERIIRETAAVPTTLTDDEAESIPLANYPVTRLAIANALSAGGQFEASEAAYIKLISGKHDVVLKRDAQFNLASNYLKQGMRKDLPGSTTRPMLEIAKQRYRDLLREDPNDWDARFNLELALRLAPEASYTNNPKGNPIKSVDVIVPGFSVPDLP